MIAATVALALVVMQPPPRTDADRLQAAMQFWNHHGPTRATLDDALRQAVSSAVKLTLASAGIRAEPNKRSTDAYIAQYAKLNARMLDHVPANREATEQAVAECVMGEVIRTMTSDEIHEADKFATTPAGAKFLAIMGPSFDEVQACYEQALSLRPDAADYLAIGVKPPPGTPVELPHKSRTTATALSR